MSDVLGLVAGNQELRQKQRTGRKQRGPEGPLAQGH
jgi:hypothetical protein